MALSGTGSRTGGWYAPLNLSTATNLPLSVSAWIRMPSGLPDTGFFALSADDNSGSYASLACVYAGGILYNDAYDDNATAEGGEYATWSPPITWQHVCIQWIDGTIFNLWINGQPAPLSASFNQALGTATFSQIRAGWAHLGANEPAFTTGAALAEI